jgi:hypothetical protein
VVLPLLVASSAFGFLSNITDAQKLFLYFFYICQFVRDVHERSISPPVCIHIYIYAVANIYGLYA